MPGVGVTVGEQIEALRRIAGDRTAALIRDLRPELVINVALPYQDLPIMDACLEAGVSYLDTANYEPKDEAKFEYHWQWAYHDRFREAGLMALLGSGFDPGVTSVFTMWLKKHKLKTIRQLDAATVNARLDAAKDYATKLAAANGKVAVLGF